MKRIITTCAVTFALLLSSSTFAAVVDIYAKLGADPNNLAGYPGPGTGELKGTFDTGNGQFSFTITYEGLESELGSTGVALHGPVRALKNDRGHPVFTCYGLDCLTQPRNPVPDISKAANNRATFGPIASGSSVSFAIEEGGRRTSQIEGLSSSFKRDAELTEIDDVLLGFWYVDIHTRARGNEPQIRGFIQVVPDVSAVPLPAAAWLFIPALSALGLFRRRREECVSA
jgi:hypothetical protein